MPITSVDSANKIFQDGKSFLFQNGNNYVFYEGFQLYINGQKRSEQVLVESIFKQDRINEQVDTLRFSILKYGSQGFTPVVNQEVKLYVGGVFDFGGTIQEIRKVIIKGNVLRFDVVCSDFTSTLNRKIVLERYDNKTAEDIISDIIATYADAFTTTNVVVSIDIKSVIFNRVSVSEAFDTLAKKLNYSWYVDYDKDIHFFAKNQNSAPFGITDSNGNYLEDTLEMTDDLNQVRNVVVIRGGEERGETRSEGPYDANGEQITFPLALKFAELPTLILTAVGGATSTISLGIEFLDNEDDFDSFWDFNQKSIRFKDGTKPADGEMVQLEGIPLYPILVKVKDGDSITEFGEFEFFKQENSLRSREEALQFADAQIEAYKDKLVESSFLTDKPGLRSGQLIRINSSLIGINEQFLIQSVDFRLMAKESGKWNVRLASLRTVGILEVLQDLIRKRDIKEFDPELLLEITQHEDNLAISDSVSPIITTSPPYQWVGPIGDQDNKGIWNKVTWSKT